MNKQAFGKKGTMIAAVAIAMLVGATGATFLKVTAVNAQTTTPAASAVTSQSQNSSSGSSSAGTVKSNENPSHEAQESAGWEEAENAGKQPWMNPSAYGGNPQSRSPGSLHQ